MTTQPDYATAAADGLTAALDAIDPSMSYTDIVKHLTTYPATGPAAEAIAAAARSLVEDHDYVSPWNGVDTSLDTHVGAVAYLVDYRAQVRSGYYHRALLLDTAAAV